MTLGVFAYFLHFFSAATPAAEVADYVSGAVHWDRNRIFPNVALVLHIFMGESGDLSLS